MNTQEIEALYIDAAKDFKELLAVPESVYTNGPWTVGAVADCRIVLYRTRACKYEWQCASDARSYTQSLLPELAVASMTESWRQRLDQKHAVWFVCPNPGQFVPVRGSSAEQVLQKGMFVKTIGFVGRDCGTVWESLPEAICAAVKTLADEKRANNLTLSRMLSKLDGPRNAVLAAVANEARLRQIIREELARALRDGTVNPR